MAAAFTDTGSRERLPVKQAAKHPAATKLGSKQPAGSDRDLARQVPHPPASNQPVPSELVSNAPFLTTPTDSAQIDAHSGDPNFMTSLARGLAVIQAFSQRQRELTVSQISAK